MTLQGNLPGTLTAVLIYRGITFWLAVAIGWVVYLFLRRMKPPATAPPAPVSPGPAAKT